MMTTQMESDLVGSGTAPRPTSAMCRRVLLASALATLAAASRAKPAGANQPTASLPTARVQADDGLNLRVEPRVTATVIAVLPYRSLVEVRGAAADGSGLAWLPVRTLGATLQEGWVAQQWLVPISPPPAPAAASPPADQPPAAVSTLTPLPTGLWFESLQLTKGSGEAQYVVADGVRYHVADLATLRVLDLGGYRLISDKALSQLRAGPPLQLRPGTLVRGRDGRVWLVGAGGQRQWIPDLDTFYALGFAWAQVHQTADWALARVPVSVPVERPLRPASEAVSWARARLGLRRWNRLCQQFAEAAYGTTRQYLTAWAARQRLIVDPSPGGWARAPLGALLFFRPHWSNDQNGHVGLHLGAGRMVSATYTGVRVTDIPGDSYWQRLYAGWGLPHFDV